MFFLRIIKHKLLMFLYDVLTKVLHVKPPLLLIGRDSSTQLCQVIASTDVKKLLLVSDADLTRLGLYQPMLDKLRGLGVDVAVFDGVAPNPTEKQNEAGVAAAQARGAEALLAFAGGSSMDAAKVIAAGVTNDKPIAKLEGALKVKKQPLPLYVVPTTAGTGSVTTVAAVVTNTEERRKYTVADLKLMPLAAALDAELMVGLPPKVTAATGMDVLTHAIESYISTRATPEVKQQAMLAARLVFKNLVTAYRDGSNIEARELMALASYQAGAAMNVAALGYVHAIAHQLGGHYHIPHGLANAVVLPHVLRFSREEASGRLAELARGIGLGSPADSDLQLADQFIAAVVQLQTDLDIPTHFEQIQEADIPQIASRANDEAFLLFAVPRYMRQDDLESMVRDLQQAA